VRSGSPFQQVAAKTLGGVSGFVSSFDLHTSLENGYCFSRFNLSDQMSSTYLDQPVVQIGKYKGEFPFELEISGVYKEDIFSETLVINQENAFQSDTTARKAWAGNFIMGLENQEQTNDVVNEIVDHSISNRVLSIYSAFLCLEPSRGGVVCYDCLDESMLSDVEDLNSSESDSLSFGAYPNPFNNAVQIKVSVPSSEVNEKLNFKIYNILGQVVKTFEININNSTNDYNFTWYGKNDAGSFVASGTYFFVTETIKKRHSMKIVYIK
jgi:Ca-activated chloride channel family protein